MTCGLGRTWEPEEGIRLGGHADAQQGVLRLVVYLGFPVVDLVLLGNR